MGKQNFTQIKKKACKKTLQALSRDDRVRTCDILVPNQARYQLRYIPIYWAVRDSNSRQPGCKPGALPTELTVRNVRVSYQKLRMKVNCGARSFSSICEMRFRMECRLENRRFCSCCCRHLRVKFLRG